MIYKNRNFFPLFFFIFFAVSCGGGEKSDLGTSQGNNQTNQTPFTWQSISPLDAGLDPNKLENAIDYALVDGGWTQGILVAKDGKIVSERYRSITPNEATSLASNSVMNTSQEYWLDEYGLKDSSSLVSSWSTAKSFTSILVGIAIDKGFISSVEDPASDYITEWQGDNRSSITIRNLLDMRSTLVPTCGDSSTTSLYPCNDRVSSGGVLIYADDQLSSCLAAEKAQGSVPQPWSNIGIYEYGHWRYSNCDTQILGEIIFRSTGQDPFTFADTYLFSKLNMTALWWRDNTEVGQANGNYLTYCCLDATIRDFAKFGQMILNGGELGDQRIVSESYINSIKNIVNDSVVTELESYAPSFSYGLKFWTIQSANVIDPQTSETLLYPPSNTIFSTIGFDGQYIVIDFENNMVIVRNGLYMPYLNYSDQRKMKLNSGSLDQSNYTGTLPAGMGFQVSSNFYIQNLLFLINYSKLSNN